MIKLGKHSSIFCIFVCFSLINNQQWVMIILSKHFIMAMGQQTQLHQEFRFFLLEFCACFFFRDTFALSYVVQTFQKAQHISKMLSIIFPNFFNFIPNRTLSMCNHGQLSIIYINVCIIDFKHALIYELNRSTIVVANQSSPLANDRVDQL